MLFICLIFAIFGSVLGYCAIRFRVQGNPVADQIEALLPQTQCGQCGYPGCRPYADAIAAGVANINQCPPGGEDGIKALADLLGIAAKPLNQENGVEKPKRLAFIIEQDCIGCIKCIQACPVDAILGAAKQMHTVIESECTGCELCVDPCPVDCIIMAPIKQNIGNWHWPQPEQRVH